MIASSLLCIITQRLTGPGISPHMVSIRRTAQHYGELRSYSRLITRHSFRRKEVCCSWKSKQVSGVFFNVPGRFFRKEKGTASDTPHSDRNERVMREICPLPNTLVIS